MCNGFSTWTRLRLGMAESRQWAQSHRSAKKDLVVQLPHCSQYGSQIGTLSLYWTLSLLPLLGKTGLQRSCQRCTQSPRSPRMRLQMSNNLTLSFASFHLLTRGSLPKPGSETLKAYWGSESLRVLRVLWKGLWMVCHICSFCPQLWTRRRYSSSTGVIDTKCQILPQVAKCCQVDPEAHLRIPDAHLLLCFGHFWGQTT